jgi:hypothetical protein
MVGVGEDGKRSALARVSIVRLHANISDPVWLGHHGFAERAFGLQVNYDGEVLMDEYVKVPEKAPLSSRGARYSTVRVSAAHQHSARAGHRLSDECERN